MPDNQVLSGGQFGECDDKSDVLIYTEERMDIDKPTEGKMQTNYKSNGRDWENSQDID